MQEQGVSGGSGVGRFDRRWHIGLWVVQIFLALSFCLGASYRLFAPISELAAKMPWAGAVPPEVVRISAAAEILGALGLILPSWLRIKPMLTPLAAIGLVVVMVLAMCLHASRGEYNFLPVNLFLGGLASLVAWGRSRRAPIPESARPSGSYAPRSGA